MNIYRRNLILMMAIIGLVWFAREARASQTGFFVVPTMNVVVDGIEVRDAQNRIVTAADAQRDLEQIFSAGIVSLLTTAELHSVARSLAVISRTVNTAAMAFARETIRFVKQFVQATAPLKRMWELVLICLTGLLSWGLVIVSSHIVRRFTPLAVVQTAPVVLRC